MAERTQGLWSRHPEEPNRVQGPDGKKIAIVTIYYGREAECLATAEFIVRACNAHDALLAALVPLAAMAEHYPFIDEEMAEASAMVTVSGLGDNKADVRITVADAHWAAAALALAEESDGG